MATPSRRLRPASAAPYAAPSSASTISTHERKRRPESGATMATAHRRRRGGSFRTGTFISSKIVKVSRRLKATPSRIARTTCRRPWCAPSGRQAPTRVRVQMRRALAHQIGRPRARPIRAGGILAASSVSRSYGSRFRRAGIVPTVIAEPAQRKTCRLGDAHHVPSAGNRVAKRVDARPRGSSAGADPSRQTRRPTFRSSR